MLTINGKFLGIKTDTIKPKQGDSFTVQSAVLQVRKAGGLPGEVDSIDVKFSRDTMSDGTFAAFQSCTVGELIAAPVSVSARASGDRAYVTFYAAGMPVKASKAA